MDCFDNFIYNHRFYDFANQLEGKIHIHQFTRINGTTVSWTEHACYDSNTPNIFIKLVFDKNNIPNFELTVKFSKNIEEPRIFDTAVHAVDFVNDAINEARGLKRFCDEIWHRYGVY